MSLTAGEKLGFYEILAPLGAGGMGEVYRARDTRLGREVAIKVLPEEFTQHPQKLARFEREARLLAALNHPGIATLYGVEEAKGPQPERRAERSGVAEREAVGVGPRGPEKRQPFLVMELVEGETLAERISRGALPVAECLEISHRIAEALEAAHERGVIHRDLKPANIKVDPEGHVKVLDFGLAKLAEAESESSGEGGSQSPTLSRDATRAGVILGTAAYMSPEQAKGKAIDKRTDIFSFGIVLYEMLTGKRAFSGEDVSDVLASIMKLEPDWKAVPPDLDPRIHKLLRQCLRKDRKNRRQSVGDIRVEIQDILAEPRSASTTAAIGPDRNSVGRMALLAAIVTAVVTGITVWNVTRPDPSTPRQPSRFAVTLPAGNQLMLTFVAGGIALSPDGRDLVYVGDRDGVPQLYRRSMNQLEVVNLGGTEGASYPFFSPDGEWVGFFANRQLKKVSLAGGPPVTLCDAGSVRGASWVPDGAIVFATLQSRVLMQVSAAGGTPEPITTLENDEVSHRWPSILPGGKVVLFAVWFGNLETARIAALSLETGERRMLIGGFHPRYAPTGHLVFARANSLWAVPFDTDRLASMGEPTPVLERVQVTSTGRANFALANDGSLAYVPGAQANRSLVRVDREGQVERLEAAPAEYWDPAISPDGRRIAVRVGTGESDLWIYEWERDIMTRLTFDPALDEWPVWTPDGAHVIFRSARGSESTNLYAIPSDGSGSARRLTESEASQFPSSWSPDGKALAMIEIPVGGRHDVLTLPLDAESFSSSEPVTPEPFVTSTSFVESKPMFSPDGRFIAYESDESGQVEIHVRPFPGPGGRWQVSNAGGGEPRWSPKGDELFYRNEGVLFAVPYTVHGGSFQAGTPRVLFDGTFYSQQLYRWYDVFPDGEHFLMMQTVESETPELVFIVNWFEELKRLVPTN